MSQPRNMPGFQVGKRTKENKPKPSQGRFAMPWVIFSLWCSCARRVAVSAMRTRLRLYVCVCVCVWRFQHAVKGCRNELYRFAYHLCRALSQ